MLGQEGLVQWDWHPSWKRRRITVGGRDYVPWLPAKESQGNTAEKEDPPAGVRGGKGLPTMTSDYPVQLQEGISVGLSCPVVAFWLQQPQETDTPTTETESAGP